MKELCIIAYTLLVSRFPITLHLKKKVYQKTDQLLILIEFTNILHPVITVLNQYNTNMPGKDGALQLCTFKPRSVSNEGMIAA